MSTQPQLLGSFTNWVILRLGELVFVAGSLFCLVAQRQKLSIPLEVSSVGLLPLLLVYFHPFAFGCADDEGIVFCRYFWLHFVPWNEVAHVERPQRIHFELVVRLGRRVGLTKAVKFPMNFARQEVNGLKDGRTTEIVTWVMDHLSSSQGTIPQGCSSRRGQQDA
jgi:hypothetical protein